MVKSGQAGYIDEKAVIYEIWMGILVGAGIVTLVAVIASVSTYDGEDDGGQ